MKGFVREKPVLGFDARSNRFIRNIEGYKRGMR